MRVGSSKPVNKKLSIIYESFIIYKIYDIGRWMYLKFALLAEQATSTSIKIKIKIKQELIFAIELNIGIIHLIY